MPVQKTVYNFITQWPEAICAEFMKRQPQLMSSVVYCEQGVNWSKLPAVNDCAFIVVGFKHINCSWVWGMDDLLLNVWSMLLPKKNQECLKNMVEAKPQKMLKLLLKVLQTLKEAEEAIKSLLITIGLQNKYSGTN